MFASDFHRVIGPSESVVLAGLDLWSISIDIIRLHLHRPFTSFSSFYIFMRRLHLYRLFPDHFLYPAARSGVVNLWIFLSEQRSTCHPSFDGDWNEVRSPFLSFSMRV
jgi:hypothetical protein